MSNFEEKQRKMAMGLEALARLRKAKGKEMPSSLEGIRKDLKVKGIKPEDNENFGKMNKGLDMLEDMKKGKAAENKGVEKEKTIVCSKCGKEVHMSNFCNNCGNKLKKESEELKNSELILSEESVGDERIEDKINLIKSQEDLFNFLDSIPGIQGSNQFFESGRLRQVISEVFNMGDEHLLNRVTRTAGLRDKVKEIMVREKIYKI